MAFEVRDGVGDWPLELFKDCASTSEIDGNTVSFTFQESQEEPLLEANNIYDEVPYEGQMFNSYGEAYEFYYAFARKNGFSIRREHTYKSSKNQTEENPLGIYKREFVCHRAGSVKQRKIIEEESQRKRKSSRCNCGAKMLINKKTIDFEEKWVVKYFYNYHNHDLLDDKEIQFLPAYRNIPIVDKNRILLLSKVGCSVSLIIRVLELEKRIDPGNLPFLEKDIRNFIQSESGIDKENDASNLLKLCKSLKDRDNAFQYDFTIDENNKLEHIIWAFGDSIRAYEAFGDVVVFDTTYRINRYDTPLGLWVGVDNHGNSIFFGCVLLRNENFLNFVKGKCPQTILTDQDLALKEAISMEFPNTKHAFCIWHIVAMLSSWFSFPLGSRYNEFKYEFYRLYNLECANDFEQEWNLMVSQFGLTYLRDLFFAGMTTTGRSKSMNSYIKRFLDVGVAVNIRNQAGEEARMRQKYYNPQIITGFPLEEHAASILTPYAFELLQHEIQLSTKYAAIDIGNDSCIVRHHTKVNGGRSVSWIDEEESIHCSCKEFEFSGILCRHAIHVLLMKNYS
ncbi:protein FAR1-RELATED SEQUENCE 11 [Cajanus cajan]|uniref:protein FAR1-RELATED SEQUENCE 11 n=1 Tax=Cajanus cajan TaxID=3821 RepID=UPI00098D810A|nr:protein FAR1-RELATED SEQUENCE 11 [Cajanus cajan]